MPHPVTKTGLVYLIGGGPGDPDLITVKGLKALRSADVILYDNLAPRELLAEAKAGAELINCGKRANKHTLIQDEINTHLVAHAQQGKIVARLKGGDPFVFGRGGEEAEACRLAGIPFEVIPGISSALAVPAYAGIPVTHRDMTSTFAVITGHEDPTKPSTMLDYAALAKIGTLIILMGVKQLPKIAAELVAAGRQPDTPVACIESGTTSKQRTIIGTLATIVELAEAQHLQAPAVIVVGEVVNLHEHLQWWKSAEQR
jgi:uroporphyrinogen III methyltransferase / synthase